MVILNLENVSKTYPGKVPVHALHNVSISIGQGEYVAIEGPSGSGKSTLLNLIALLDSSTMGHYLIDREETTGLGDAERARLRSSTFAFIFQSFHLLKGRTLVDNVALGTLYRSLPASRRRELSMEALGFVGLTEKADEKIENLSGGQRQRAAIARAIASGTPVVVADEPTGNLDTASGELVMQTLERLNASGTTVIIVTHDHAVAARATRHLHVVDGHVRDAIGDSDDEAETVPRHGRIAEHDAPVPEGKDSKVRFADAVADAWKGLWVKPARTMALVGAVALGVGLALTTAGLAQTARYQVSDIFDAQRNQRVCLTATSFEENSPAAEQTTSSQALTRLKGLAGVEDAGVFTTHAEVPVATRPGTLPENQKTIAVVGTTDGYMAPKILTIDTQGTPVDVLGEGEVVVGVQAASDLDLGPLLASPTIWVHGEPKRVVGVLTDAGLQVGLLSSIVTGESEAHDISAASYSTVELKASPGAAQQVARQAPLAWIPATPDLVSVDAPPDPTTLRDQIESNLATVLLTLTGVALLAAVLSLTNAMTTAVYQRVGEFGLRRAIGARRIHIRGLVLAESLAIGTLGGCLGAYLSVLAILAVTIARSWQPVLAPASIPMGIVGGVLVGLFGGLIATRRASTIQPQDALRA